ncbi:DNA gyrase inhibitor YacG [Mycoavidus sp. B2-EB]|uniref:DNA gyrase inhibitor YacG n=1 Tax=Mycoavidus sp. B2-EB TaxID=2651972 RepID=UPI001623513D|nr:DNA gyrase inhibitor YacG [Mycoavidus sp. B2-EB]BBO59100.1 DNA gyrase inhibitor YacG [Mycoavidus sp. B2-EB]
MNIVVNCPICNSTVEWKSENHYRPFCSERCKKIDLGTWAAENYVISESQETPAEADTGDDSD